MVGNGAMILLVDDEKSILHALRGILEDEGYSVSTAEDGESALATLEDVDPDLVLLDIWLPGRDGMSVLEEIKTRWRHIPVIMISGHGTIELAVGAVKKGAFDFIEKPLSLEKVLLTAQNALRLSRLEAENRILRKHIQPRDEITGRAPVIERLRSQIEIVAPTSSWVLIQGENGTGKEVVARAIFSGSKLADKPFVEVNCAAIPEDLIESELFGHEKGAFTGAVRLKEGKFYQADGGTLFLDEIGDMSLSTQAKILRILQEQKFQRIGGSETIEVRVRVIAATNKDLPEEISEGRFREDLYHRLNVIPIVVPPLKDRLEDIPVLVEEFVDEFCHRNGYPRKEFDPAVIEAFYAYDWPGNVRELKNMVERLLVLSPSSRIRPEDLQPPVWPLGKPAPVLSEQNLKTAREDFERVFIEDKLRECGGNISKTAEHIGLERSHLHKKIKELGIRVVRNG